MIDRGVMKNFVPFLSCLAVFSLLASTSQATDTFIVSGNPKASPIVWEEHNKLTGIGPDLPLTKSFTGWSKTEPLRNFLFKHFDTWKKLIDKRSRFFYKDSSIRNQEYQGSLETQDTRAKDRIGSLLAAGKSGRFAFNGRVTAAFLNHSAVNLQPLQ